MSLLNRVVATLLALVLLLGGLLVAVEIVLAQLGRPELVVPHRQWAAWARQETWDAPAVRALLAGLVLLGLLLLVLALRRGKPRTLPLPPREGRTPPGVEVHASRRGVERMLAAATSRVSGVDRAQVSLTRRNARVRASTPTRSQPDLSDDVARTVTQELDRLGLDRLRPQVSITRKGGR